MRLVFGAVLVAGVGLAGFAVNMAQDRIGQYQTALAASQANSQNSVEMKSVFVATKTLDYGDVLTEEDVREAMLPIDAIPEGAFFEKAALFDENPNKPRQVLRLMTENELLLAHKLTNSGEEAGVATLLSPGMRAFSIKVDDTTGVAGLLNADDHVDVYWTGNRGDGLGNREGGVTKLIQANVKLVAIDASADKQRGNSRSARTVTVEVSPQQVASLAQAQNSGKLSLSLVGIADDIVASVEEVDQNRLLGQLTQAAPKRVCTIKTRKGGVVTELPIPCSN